MIDLSTIDALERDEGFRAKSYRDSEGLLTIGFGTLIEDGISKEEAGLLLRHRLEKAVEELEGREPLVSALPAPVQSALAQMAYNLGVPRLMLFKDMWACLERKDFPGAAVAALDSRWAEQVGSRANRIAELIRNA